MTDYSALLQIVKQAAVEAVAAEEPTALFLAEVKSVKPLVLRLDAETFLNEKELLLTETAAEKSAELYFTDPADAQPAVFNEGAGILRFTEAIPLKITLRNTLKVGDTVLLLREAGGRRYILLDRVVGL